MSVAECPRRAAFIVFCVVDHVGSRSAGYTTASSFHDTRSVHVSAPGRTTARPHGPAGFVSWEQSGNSSLASVRTPSDPTIEGGATRRRGAPPSSSISTELVTSRRPLTPLRRTTLY